MKEFGGYIEFEHFNGKPFHQNGMAFNSGRSCLGQLILSRGISHIYIPSFLCDSIRNMCDYLGVGFSEYKIGYDLLPINDQILELKDKEYLYLVNYYGQITKNSIIEIQEKNHNIILENTHDFFENPINGIDTIFVARKYFGVADGAYLYPREKIDNAKERDIVHERMCYLLGRFEENATKYYDGYVSNDSFFDKNHILMMSSLSQNILNVIDYEFVRNRRTRNFAIVHERLKKYNRMHVHEYEGPFTYPLFIYDAQKTRRRLIDKKIYIPMLWPDVLERCAIDSIEYDLASNILPIPIDQRYIDDDMVLMCDMIEEELNRE